tara:strand:+ start:2497 stop:2703 length:207 start_codon:yes stop_codon:yes gene_type:complete
MKRKIIVLENGAMATFGSKTPEKYAITGTNNAVTGSGIISVIHRPAQTNRMNNPFWVISTSKMELLKA